jgi:hypothetical protein
MKTGPKFVGLWYRRAQFASAWMFIAPAVIGAVTFAYGVLNAITTGLWDPSIAWVLPFYLVLGVLAQVVTVPYWAFALTAGGQVWRLDWRNGRLLGRNATIDLTSDCKVIEDLWAGKGLVYAGSHILLEFARPPYPKHRIKVTGRSMRSRMTRAVRVLRKVVQRGIDSNRAAQSGS